MRVLYVYETDSTRYVVLRGRLLHLWLRQHGIPAVKAPLDRGFKLHRSRLPDVLAAAQEAGVAVRMRGVP